MRKRLLVAAASAVAVFQIAAMAGAADNASTPLTIEKGEHICIIGNTLADRMNRDGWLETLIQSRFPKDELVIRNLGFSGDEVRLDQRIRDEGFGSPDEWLSAKAEPNQWEKNRFADVDTKPDVLFAFFGYNESFEGPKGLDQFKQDLNSFVKHTLEQKYNGHSAPKLVLFSSIAQEKLPDPNLPDPAANNQNIKLYSDAMAEVAKANNVLFVDLFEPTLQAYKSAAKPLTINGIHLTPDGDKVVAQIIDRSLFGAEATPDPASIEKLRQAVNDKNFYWFHRYRPLDGFNVYGGRSHMAYKPIEDPSQVKGKPNGSKNGEGITNREVMQRELLVLGIMTQNRDKRVWAVAQGGDLKVDDSNTPPFIPAGTNEPGKGPHGEHLFRSGEEEIQHMKLGKGMKVNLFADEKMFPELANPVQMAWDAKGRLWVAVWPQYPDWMPKTEMSDKVLILEDTNGDGKADKCTVFADHLNCPSGLELYKDGVIVAQAPGLLFMKDTTGGDHANYSKRLLEGLDSADTHHTSNSFTFDPGGALYWQEGTFMHSQVETIYGPIREINGAVWRYEPLTQKFDTYTSYGFANPHGHVWDCWGTDVVMDGTGAEPYYGPSFSGKLYFPEKHGRAPTIYRQRTRPCPGAEILSSKVFPPELQGNMLVPNVIGFQGILNYKLNEDGSGLAGVEGEPIISCNDPNFRPVDVEMGPDGAIYFLDWQNPIIGHLQHHLRDTSRDHTHGRIYRITYEGKTEKPVKIAGEPVDKLLDLLKEPENRVRYRAKIELSAHPTKDVIPALEKWIAGLSKADPNYEHNLLEGLWVYQWNNTVNEPLLKELLRAKDPHARAAATRVLCYWRDRVSNPLALLKVQATDDSPRVRLEAVRACSFFTDPKAADTALESVNKPQDRFLKYALDETMKTLDKHAK